MSHAQQAIAIYTRKSKFTGKGESVGNQAELCRAYIRLHFGEEAAETAIVYEDEGFSGGNLNRPDFKRMMEAARAHRLSAIIVYRLDRISRNISDFSNLIDDLERLQIDFISIREKFDTSSSMGRAMMFLTSVFSQLERETIAERIRDNMHELAKTGRWLGGTTPTGYTSESIKTVSVNGKSKKACRLALLPEEAELVKHIFRRFLATDSLTAVEAELLQQCAKTKTGRDFTRFSIKNILRNPVYLIADAEAYRYFADRNAELFSGPSDFDGQHGILAYHRTDQKKGRAAIDLPMQEWIISVGQHPGLIPGRDWIRVQESLERNRSRAYRKPRSNGALLTGVIFCRCGSRMYPKLTKRLNADGQPIYSYLCKRKETSRASRCSARNANGNLLDAAVISEIRELSENAGTFLSRLEMSKRHYTVSRDRYEAKPDKLRKEMADHDKKIAGLIDSLAGVDDSGTRKLITGRIEELGRSREELAARIAAWECPAEAHRLSGTEFDLMRRRFLNFRESIDGMSIEQKRSAVRALVRKVVWDGECAHVVLFGAQGSGIECSPSLPSETENIKEEDSPGELHPPVAAKARRGENSIFDAAGGIGGKTRPLFRSVAGDSLDQSDRAD